jgi:phage virion morphogenesis protein
LASFAVTVDDRALRAALGRLTRGLANPTPALEDVARALANITEDAFQRQRSPFGEPWADLKDKTKARREKAGHWPGPILQVTAGGLAGSITHGADRSSAWVAASKVYAAIHQFGGTPEMRPGPAGIPARPYLPVDETGALAPAARDETLEILAGYLRDLA